jgi:Tfp pilus assembly protein PilF
MEYEKAIATLKKLLEKEPDSAPAYAALARALAAKGDIARSREALNKALSLEPGNLQTRLAAARFSFFARDMPALQQELAAIPANFQELPDVLYIKGLSARLSGDDGAALDYFERTFEQIQTPETMAAVAQQRWQMDRKQASLAFQKEWLSAHPDDSDSRLRLAHYLKRQGENELALDQYALVLEHDGTNTAALNSSAWMLRDSDPAKGLGLIERALKVDATNPALLDTKGVLLLKNAQFKEAELQFNKALLAQPDEPNVLYHLAMLKVAENDTDEAERILEKVLSNAMPFAERDAATALLLSVQGKQSK